MPRALLALGLALALLAAPRPCQANGIDPGHVALGSTLGSYAVLMASEFAMLNTMEACPACGYGFWGVAAVAGLGTMVGPCAGHIYVGKYGHAALWTGLRMVAMAAAVVPIIVWVDAGFAVAPGSHSTSKGLRLSLVF